MEYKNVKLNLSDAELSKGMIFTFFTLQRNTKNPSNLFMDTK